MSSGHGRPGINVQGSEPKFQKLWDICSWYKIENSGEAMTGNKYTFSLEDLKKRCLVGHAVFKDQETLTRFIKELKEAELGLSTVVSGLYDDVKGCCGRVGIKPPYCGALLGSTETLQEAPRARFGDSYHVRPCHGRPQPHQGHGGGGQEVEKDWPRLPLMSWPATAAAGSSTLPRSQVAEEDGRGLNYA
jgi:hypothetical protein